MAITITFPHIAALAAAAAARIATLMKATVTERGSFHWALAGGRTPIVLYRELTTTPYLDLPWRQVHIWFGDERAVSPEHPDSNLRMARESLLDHIPLPSAHLHPMPANPDYLRQGAWAYSQSMKSWLPHCGEIPCLDLVLLGLGGDGHMASLFPGSCALHQTQQAAVAVYAPGPRTWRMTLTLPVIEHARQVMLLVTGIDKAQTVARVFAPTLDTPLLPIQRIAPHGEVTWYLDTAAASLLP